MQAYVSTYRVDIDRVIGITGLLTSRLMNAGVDAIVLEVADGLYQEETARLLSSTQFRNIVDGVIFASDSAIGAKMGMMWLQEHGLPMLLALSGAVTRSPLAVIEAKEATGLPVLNLESLSFPIDKTGKVVIKPKFTEARDFDQGIARIKNGSKWGYINKTGTITIKPHFERARDFSEGLASVKMQVQ